MYQFQNIVKLEWWMNLNNNSSGMRLVQQGRKNNEVPKIDDVNFIEKTNGFVKGYAVNTFHGLVKNYNQDRVSIIMNITKPNYKGRWPKCSYFGVFDGHGGSACSDFLKDNMHKYITQNEYFPHKPIDALKEGFKNAESQFLKMAETRTPVQKSGSCAIVLLVIDNVCYVANVGDSRAILSTKSGREVFSISRDHKPDSPNERSRIIQAGGNIYQSSIKKNGNTIYGPFRIEPGKLSVSRSFGDIEAKKVQYGGNPNVLISKPEITYFTIDPNEHDFIMMGSDGIFDKMENEDIIGEFWSLRNEVVDGGKGERLEFIGRAASRVITKAMTNMSLDNLTTLFVVFDCEERMMGGHKLALRDQNAGQHKIDSLSRYQRSRSSAQQKSNHKDEQGVCVSKFSLKREVSKSNLGSEGMKKGQGNGRLGENRHERQEMRKEGLSEMKKRVEQSKSSLGTKVEQENTQMNANRQQSHSEYLKQDVSQTKTSQMRSIESKVIQNKNTAYSSNELGGQNIQRKKSHGLLRRDSKKQSIWGAISRGLRSGDSKVVEKIRY